MSSILHLMKMTRPEAIQLSGRSASEPSAPPAGPYPADFEPDRLLSSYVLDDEPPEFVLDESFPPPPPAETSPRPRRPRGAAAIPHPYVAFSFLSLLCMFAIAGGIALFPARVGNVQGALPPARMEVIPSYVAPPAEQVYVAAAVVAPNPGDVADAARQAALALQSAPADLTQDEASQAVVDQTALPLAAETLAPPLDLLPAPAPVAMPPSDLSLAPADTGLAALASDSIPTVLPTDVHPSPQAATPSESELAVADAFRAVALELQPIDLPEPSDDEYFSAAPLPAPGATEVLYEAGDIPLATADSPAASGSRRAPTRASRASAAPPVERVEGIFYDKVRPMALIGGQIVEVGASAAGGTIVAINPSSVVIHRNGRQITLAP